MGKFRTRPPTRENECNKTFEDTLNIRETALRYRTKVHEIVDKNAALYEDALDETGTVDTECLTDSDDGSIGEGEIQQYNNTQ